MTIYLHLKLVGAFLLVLGLAHGAFVRLFNWNEDLAKLPLLLRQVVHVHNFFIGLMVAMIGVCSLFYTSALLTSGPLSRIVLTGLVVFWSFRLAFQFFVYDASIWRGRRFYTFMHVAFVIVWSYVVLTYSVALHTAWRV